MTESSLGLNEVYYKYRADKRRLLEDKDNSLIFISEKGGEVVYDCRIFENDSITVNRYYDGETFRTKEQYYEGMKYIRPPIYSFKKVLKSCTGFKEEEEDLEESHYNLRNTTLHGVKSELIDAIKRTLGDVGTFFRFVYRYSSESLDLFGRYFEYYHNCDSITRE